MAAQYTRDDAKITVIVNGVGFEGWLQSEVERSIEALAGTFSVPVSLVPGSTPTIARQSPVSIKIGDEADRLCAGGAAVLPARGLWPAYQRAQQGW
jgi:hypothetical protein